MSGASDLRAQEAQLEFRTAQVEMLIELLRAAESALAGELAYSENLDDQEAERRARDQIHLVLCMRGTEQGTYSTRWRRQSICKHCWNFLDGRQPIRGPRPWAQEICSYCGFEHRSGIYLRERDDRVLYPRQEPAEER